MSLTLRPYQPSDAEVLHRDLKVSILCANGVQIDMNV